MRGWLPPRWRAPQVGGQAPPHSGPPYRGVLGTPPPDEDPRQSYMKIGILHPKVPPSGG